MTIVHDYHNLWNVLESVTNVVHLTSDSDDAATDVAMVNIGPTGQIVCQVFDLWITICKLPNLSVPQFTLHFVFEIGTNLYVESLIL